MGEPAPQISSPISVIAAVVERNEQFLVCRRPPHKRHPHLWEFPGGKVESGETLELAATRELKEELDLLVVHTGAVLMSELDEEGGFKINFLEVIAEGDPVLVEHSAYCWATLMELVEMNLAPVDRKFVQHMRMNSGSTK